MQLDFGARVRCGGDEVGELADVIVDPVARRISHVVVMTDAGLPRLVPFRLVDLASGADGISLHCSVAKFETFPAIRHFAYLRFDELADAGPDTDVGVEDVIGMGSFESAEYGYCPDDFVSSVAITYDAIPSGQAELRRDSGIISADGHRVGHVNGFELIDDRVTHVILVHRHLWKTRATPVPVHAVAEFSTDSVSLAIDRDALSALRH
jgi:hypothetical protein